MQNLQPVENTSVNTGKLVLSTRALLMVGLVYLVVLGGAEYISHYISAFGGILFYIVILFSLIVYAALTADSGQREVWIAMGLAPLIRIISLALPVFMVLSQYLWYIIISIPILTAIISVMRILKYGPDEVGLNINKLLLQVLIVLSGILLGVLGYFVLKPEGWTAALSLQSTLFPALILIIFTGFIEELVFRGVMQRALVALGGFWWMYTAAVYAVLQIGQGSVIYCLFVLAVSLYFGYMVKVTKSILGVGLAHGLINVGLFLVFPHVAFFQSIG